MISRVVSIFRIIDLGNVARITFAITLVLFIYSIGYTLFCLRGVRLPNVTKEKINNEDYVIKNNLLPLEQYLQSVRQHQIFGSFSQENTAQANIAADPNMLKDLSLLGIIGDSSPQAIIENKRANATYQVEKGQMIGDMQVADIQAGKVIIQYEGGLYELNL